MKLFFDPKHTSNCLFFIYNAAGKIQISSAARQTLQKDVRFVEKLFREKALNPEKGELHEFFGPSLNKIVAIGLGKDKKPNLRTLGAKLGKKALSLKTKSASLALPEGEKHLLFTGLEDFLEGFLLGSYSYQEFKSPDPKEPVVKLEEVNLLLPKNKDLSHKLELAVIKAESTNLARDYGNKPGNHFTPTHFKDAAAQLAKEVGLEFYALDEAAMAKEKMGCLLGVSKGSSEPAWLSCLEYHADKKAPTLLLVGKGLTFDAGGISLKPSQGMEEMKWDMCGGAAVLGAMRIIALLKPKLNVVGLIPASENLPGPAANKPGDVLTACNGKTVEVLNTDAEGRLILADALSYGIKKYKPQAVVDIATLTGACMVALGSYNSGLLTNHKKLAEQVKQAAEVTGDPVWEMPNHELYKEQIKGTYGDLLNTGGKEAGTITAGQFLENFVDGTPWVHLDIAGTAWNSGKIPHYPEKGATGVGVRLLAELALSWK